MAMNNQIAKANTFKAGETRGGVTAPQKPAVAKNASPYDQLTNINRGKPNIAPSPTSTPITAMPPNLRSIVNQTKQGNKQQIQEMKIKQQAETQKMRQMAQQKKNGQLNPYLGHDEPIQPGDMMPPDVGNPFKNPMQNNDAFMAAIAQQFLQQQNQQPMPLKMDVEKSPQMDTNRLQQLYQQLGLQQPMPYQQQMAEQAAMQPLGGQASMQAMQQMAEQARIQAMQPMQTPQPAGLGSLAAQKFNPSSGFYGPPPTQSGFYGPPPGMGQQPMGTQNTLQYMATYDPSPFSSAQPMGTQNTQLGKMGQPAQNTQTAFGGNMLGKKNAFS
jgi:hypothetical protein